MANNSPEDTDNLSPDGFIKQLLDYAASKGYKTVIHTSTTINIDGYNQNLATITSPDIENLIGISVVDLDELIKSMTDQGILELQSTDGKVKIVSNPDDTGQSQVFFVELHGIRKAVVKVRNNRGISTFWQSYLNEAMQIEKAREFLTDTECKVLFPKIFFASQVMLIEECVEGEIPSYNFSTEMVQLADLLNGFIAERNKERDPFFENIIQDITDVPLIGIQGMPMNKDGKFVNVFYKNFILTPDDKLYCIDPFRKKLVQHSNSSAEI